MKFDSRCGHIAHDKNSLQLAASRYGSHRRSGDKVQSHWRARGIFAALLVVLVAVSLPQAAWAKTLRIVAYGDSLAAGFGLPEEQAFPAQLQAALEEKGHDAKVINAGVSGDTASAGLARLEWTLAEGADAVILELGANDALRGVDPAVTRGALTKILDELTRRDIPVLLAGMRAPPNMGAAYADRFDAIYPQLAEDYAVVFYPFFLDGVAAEPDLNQEDGIHPTADGVARIVTRILPKVEELIARAGGA